MVRVNTSQNICVVNRHRFTRKKYRELLEQLSNVNSWCVSLRLLALNIVESGNVDEET